MYFLKYLVVCILKIKCSIFIRKIIGVIVEKIMKYRSTKIGSSIPHYLNLISVQLLRLILLLFYPHILFTDIHEVLSFNVLLTNNVFYNWDITVLTQKEIQTCQFFSSPFSSQILLFFSALKMALLLHPFYQNSYILINSSC